MKVEQYLFNYLVNKGVGDTSISGGQYIDFKNGYSVAESDLKEMYSKWLDCGDDLNVEDYIFNEVNKIENKETIVSKINDEFAGVVIGYGDFMQAMRGYDLEFHSYNDVSGCSGCIVFTGNPLKEVGYLYLEVYIEELENNLIKIEDAIWC